jgi:hypothetical protein
MQQPGFEAQDSLKQPDPVNWFFLNRQDCSSDRPQNPHDFIALPSIFFTRTAMPVTGRWTSLARSFIETRILNPCFSALREEDCDRARCNGCSNPHSSSVTTNAFVPKLFGRSLAGLHIAFTRSRLKSAAASKIAPGTAVYRCSKRAGILLKERSQIQAEEAIGAGFDTAKR